MTSTDVDGLIPAQPGEPVTPDEIISASVRTLLGRHRMTGAGLAKRIEGLKQSTIYNRLNGVRSWEAREVVAIAEFFGLEVGQLYSGDFKPLDSLLADHPVRLSREHDAAGQGRFSGSDIDFLMTASLATSAA